MWEIKGRELEPMFLGNLHPEQVFFDYEGPRSYLTRDPQGELLFAHQCGETAQTWRYAVVPFSEQLVEALERGWLDLRTALDQPRLWIVEIDGKGKPVRCVSSCLSAISESSLPRPGVMVYPDLDPLLSVRSLGRRVELGQATLGLLRNSLDNVRNALKILAEYATGDVPGRGQPSAKTRKYYDLPALMLAGSVQIVVLPAADQSQPIFDQDATWQRIESLLRLGLAEASRMPDPAASPAHGDDLRVALQAVHWLAPPAYGPIDSTEITGRLTAPGAKPTLITRKSRLVLRQRLQMEPGKQPEIIEAQGLISELDREEETCLLRNAAGITLHKLSFDEGLFEEIKDAFDTAREVKVAARLVPPNPVAELLAVEFMI